MPEAPERPSLKSRAWVRLLPFLLGLGVVLIDRAGANGQDSIESYLHKHAKLGIGLIADSAIFKPGGPFPIDPREAARFAVAHLRKRGVKDIVICESHWIAAATSGYLVDGLGRLTIGGRVFTTFRVGVRDGLEARHGADYDAGREFVFIAHGCDSSGHAVWHPEPGPDFVLGPDQTVPEGLLSFEFLLHRPEFESLSVRYGR
ncbi:MAG: hypothetical protein MUQ00_01455 [Candidatus Aminicenantes bacterium]|nr:hypothetical protein [Candidatus Aminicenantes bacterium]